MRLWEALIARQLAKDEREARGLIMAGKVFVGGIRRDKAAYEVADEAGISVTADKKYVGRGGLKLERALEVFSLDIAGLTCIDIGSSTGGFTDCMLKNGAARVFAVDVGYGLLDYALRADPRVSVMERTNARALEPEALGGLCDFASADVSFISLSRIFPAMRRCLKPGAHAVALIKPQFEAAKEQVGKGGVVREAAVRGEVIRRVRLYAREAGLAPLEVTPSPIQGADGNIEFLLHLEV